MSPQHQVQPTSTRISPPAHRQYCGRSTSSAFSSSANPDEDWTKISDLAERRKIQNRIAQRNYRKKLKRRLEDLECRAGSSESTDSQDTTSSAPEIKRPAVSKAFLKPRQETPPSKSIPQMQLTPPLESNDKFFLSPTYNSRERSHTPPLILYSNTTYPVPDNTSLKTPYSSSQYQSMVTGAESYFSYMAPTTTTSIIPPVMHFSDTIKRGYYSSDNGIASSGYLYPSFYPVVEINANEVYAQPNPQTAPLTHSSGHSVSCSEAGYDYPTTTMSMPESPGLLQQK